MTLNMQNVPVIAIDGPTASGKGTVAQRVAQRLGWVVLDSGALVRQVLLERQRAFRQAPGLVADGRDMGTVVFPDAPLKIFLVADVAARAERRCKQLKDKGLSANLASLMEDLQARDERDRTRSNAPLVPAPDAVTIDSSNLTIEETVNAVLDHWSKIGA